MNNPHAGHGGHPNDIIPPFDFSHILSHVVYAGKNYTNHVMGSSVITGADVWNAQCSWPRPPTAGQIWPFVLCVQAQPGGTYYATFGYTANLTEPATIQAGGGDNDFTPAPTNRNQPSNFEDGLVLGAVTVYGIPNGHALEWKLTFDGHTTSATATNNPGADNGGTGVKIGDCREIAPPPDLDVPIGPSVTCVLNHGSTYDAWFGYESRNADIETIRIGLANRFLPGEENRGQPETFAPGVNREALHVEGIPSSEQLTWELGWTDHRLAIADAAFPVKCEPDGTPPPPESDPTALPIGIFATCVTHHGSHYDATFGYVNDNADVVSVPIGSDNAVSPGPPDQGQPDVFHPGFVSMSFTVYGVSASDAVTWTVRFNGELRVARATASTESCLTAPFEPTADAHVTKTATPRTVGVGHRVRFTIDVRNTGSKVLQPVVVTDTLPATLLRAVSATSTLGSCDVTTSAGSHRVHCTGPELAPGESFTIDVTARAAAGGIASDHAAVVGVPHATATAAVHIAGAPPSPSPHPPPPFTG